MGGTSTFSGSSEEVGREKSWRDGSIGRADSTDRMRTSFTSLVESVRDRAIRRRQLVWRVLGTQRTGKGSALDIKEGFQPGWKLASYTSLPHQLTACLSQNVKTENLQLELLSHRGKPFRVHSVRLGCPANQRQKRERIH